MNENYHLQRFLEAQETDYKRALSEIREGEKRSHWMWYVFPQVQGLGHSKISKTYAIKDIREGEAFLHHPLLGNRLMEICEALLKLKSNDATKIMGTPDDLKLKSSMTLFSSLQNTHPVFQAVLDKFFKGEKDQKTLQIIAGN